MLLRKQIFIFVLLCLMGTSGCSGKDSPSRVPSDFVFVMDVRSPASDLAASVHVNIRIDAKGKGQFEYYDNGGTIRYDLNGIVTYDASQVVKSGKFKLTDEKLEQLWDILNENHFFELEEDYQIAIGHSYAFIIVEANNERHIVDNIGLEVPEIRAIVESIGTLLPRDISFEYGEGVTP